MMASSIWRAGLAIALLLFPVCGRAASSGDAFVCYKSVRSVGEPKFGGATVSVADERERRTLDVKAPGILCVPADRGNGVLDPATSLLGYKAKLAKDNATYDPGIGIQILNELGELYVDTEPKPAMLLVPSTTDPDADPPAPDPSTLGVDHYRCHHAAPAVGAAFSKVQQAVVDGGTGDPTVFELKKLQQLCEPVDALGLPIKNAGNHLMCYRARRVRGEAKYMPVVRLHVSNQSGRRTLPTW